MTATLTSAVFDVWRALTRLMGETVFPTIPENPDGVAVWFGDPAMPDNVEADVPASTERVVIVPADEAVQQVWGPIGQLARDETFTAVIVATTAVPGRTAVQVLDRLQEITAPIEETIRDVTAGFRDGLRPAEFVGYQVALISVAAVNPIIVPDTDGWIGRAEIGVACQFRVGTPPVT